MGSITGEDNITPRVQYEKSGTLDRRFVSVGFARLSCGGVPSGGQRSIPRGGTDDHVHIACTLPRTLTVSKLLEAIKKSSSVWVKNQDAKLRSFAWQAGYGAFSVGESQVPVLLRYIDNQWEHHRSSTFKEEFLNFLNRYEVEYDERYLWD